MKLCHDCVCIGKSMVCVGFCAICLFRNPLGSWNLFSIDGEGGGVTAFPFSLPAHCTLWNFNPSESFVYISAIEPQFIDKEWVVSE